MPKTFNAFQLKLIAIILMLIDHTGAILFPEIILFRIIGRLAFPLFAFFIAEGYRHTRSVRHYLIRLGLGAILFQLPDWITDSRYINSVFTGWSGSSMPDIEYDPNIFFTLTLGLIAIALFDKLKNRRVLSWLAACGIALLSQMIGADYGFYGIFYILLFYLAEGSMKRMITGALFLHTAYIIYGFLSIYHSASTLKIPNLIQLYSFLSLLFIAMYNREQGRKMKYFFYLFYPLHMILLYMIEAFVRA